MRALTRFSVLALGLAMVIGLSSAALSRADDAPATATAPAKATGTISGKVLDPDGKPVKGATVNAVAGGAAAPARGQGGGGRGARPAPLATTTTGDDGTYKLDAVPVGKVRVTAMLRGTGNGRSAADLDVTAGNDTKADDIKLVARAAGGGRGGNAAPGGAAGN
jgi:hypothetical protein